jgi:hypothetical protein
MQVGGTWRLRALAAATIHLGVVTLATWGAIITAMIFIVAGMEATHR